MRVSPSEALEAIRDGLAARELALADEQAVHGLDSLDEVRLHALLGEALAAAGLAVFREFPYPGQPEELPAESARERCDLVVAAEGTAGIDDRIRRRKEAARAEGTLFAPIASQMVAPREGVVPPEEALWLEVKTTGQYTYADGLAGPNRSYASEFNACLGDIRKLARADGIAQAGVVIILFSAEEAVAEHDLAAFVHRCLDRDLPATGLLRERFPILDRIGNRVCTVAIVPVRAGGS